MSTKLLVAAMCAMLLSGCTYVVRDGRDFRHGPNAHGWHHDRHDWGRGR
jgi:hypothetical protein